MEPLELKLRPLTPIWTGGIDGQCDRLHETAIIGSLRWWYEAVVRGLGGYACDPTADGRCPVKEHQKEYHCPVCELFGCTGWSRKFRLRILDEKGKLLTGSLNTEEKITFTLEFIPLRPITPEEQWLLIKTCELICQYGSIGGRTIRKPQKKKGEISKDYGLIQKVQFPPLPKLDKTQIQQYLHSPDFQKVAAQRKNAPEWPDLKWFFFVKGTFLNRVQMNELMGLNDDGEPVKNEELSESQFELFLRGDKDKGISKKIFSFHQQDKRLWGYVQNDNMLDAVIQDLSDMDMTELKTGKEVLEHEF